MQLVTLDFETYWDSEHSLSKMLPMSYVMHPDTEIISCALKIGDDETQVYFGEPEIRAALDAVDWSDTYLLGHNMSAFDSMICAWRFGIKPRMWGCTLAMARPMHSAAAGVSLSALVAHYGLGVKNAQVLQQTKGRRLCDFTPEEVAAMRVYNKTDTDQCYALFEELRPQFTARELWHIDATVRMLVEPAFVLDAPLLEGALAQEQAQKQQQLLALAGLLGVVGQSDADVSESVRVELASAARFSALLEGLGVPTPMKPSPTNQLREIPALAKTDQGLLDLQEHDNPVVAAAAAARLSVKSTLLESRITLLLEASRTVGGRLPAPLHYCGAATTGRWSGWAYNPQNLPRVTPGKPRNSDALRMSITAPAGCKIVVADLSGIELRINHFLWKVRSSIDMYAADPEADLYRAFAATLYGIPPGEVTKSQRQLAKVAQLGLGFSAGATTFRSIARTMGGLELGEDEAAQIVATWRATYRAIVDGWRACQRALPEIYSGRETPIDPWNLCVTTRHGIALPSGRVIHYPGLRKETTDNGNTEWCYGSGRTKAKIFSGKIDENCVQGLARDVMADVTFEAFRRTGFRPALLVHDEWVGVVPEREAEAVLAEVQKIMRAPPAWWPELVTWSEGDIADRYGAAK